MKITELALSDKKKTRAAGCIFFCPETNRFCFALRGLREVSYPNHWSGWGGKCDPGESPELTVLREVGEEAGYFGKLDLVPMLVNIDGNSVYFNYLGIVPSEFTPKLNWENSDHVWVKYGRWPKPLHPGMRELLEDETSTEVMQQYAKVD